MLTKDKHIYKKFNDITLSKTHLGNIIKYVNLTYKKVHFKKNQRFFLKSRMQIKKLWFFIYIVQITHRPDTRYHKPINYDEEYEKFYSKIKKYNLDDIISIDETSISVGLHIDYGREEIGKRLDKITKDNKVFVKYSLIMAITTKGVLDWILYEKGGSDHCRLIEFIKILIEGKENKLILMDNASCYFIFLLTKI